MDATIAVLSNPNSGKNRRRRDRRRRIEAALGKAGFMRETTSLEELVPVVRELLEANCEYWVCDGGDGTLHWLVTLAARELRKQGCEVLPKIIPANGGSIDFVAHKAGIKGEAPEIITHLVTMLERGERPPLVQLDTLALRGESDADGEAGFERLGFAAAIGGIAQRFFGKLYEHERVDAWTIARVIAKGASGAVLGSLPAPRVLPRLRAFADELFAPARARIEIDGEPLAFDSLASLQIGSIDISLGGVVRTFRHAAERGTLHAQALQANRLGVVVNLPNVLLGTPIWGSRVFDGPARRLRVQAAPGHSLDPVIDGELFFGLRSLEVSAGPRLCVPRVRVA